MLQACGYIAHLLMVMCATIFPLFFFSACALFFGSVTLCVSKQAGCYTSIIAVTVAVYIGGL